MTNDEIAVWVQEVDDRSKSNTHRINTVEEQVAAFNRLASAVEVMANEQKHQTQAMDSLKTSVTGLANKVDAIEKKPGKRWDDLFDKALWAVVAAVIAFFLGRVGL